MVFVGYFAILNNCSSIILSEGLISGEKVGIIMSFQTVSSLVTGLYIGKLKKLLGRYMGTFIWLCSIGGTAVPVREEQSGIDHAGTGSVWNCPCLGSGNL